MKSPRDSALGLLEKAEHDLIAAEVILAAGRPLDTVCFHAQQAAEKSLKAALASRDIVYPKTHNISKLAGLVRLHFPELPEMGDTLASLSPYAIEMRYDTALDPGLEEARQALETAKRVYALVEQFVKT